MSRSLRMLLGLLAAATFLLPARAGDAERLGTTAVPVSEDVVLCVDPDRTDYDGSVRITIEVRETTDRLRFHAEDLSLDRVRLRAEERPIEFATRRGERGLVELTATSPLEPGSYVLEIDFSGSFNTQGVGLYRVTHDGAHYLFTQFEAVDARRAFPCWDEPEFKISYQLRVTAPAGALVLSNTPVETQSDENGRRTWTFQRTPPLPSYLVALAVGPLETVPIPGTSVPARVVTVRNHSGMAGLAVAETPAILAALEEWFGGRIPFDKLDLVGVPEYWYGAMENPGAVTYRDNLLLVEPNAVTPDYRRVHVGLTAHELAHMWFGNLVTMRWWDDLWLNESFAEWMGNKIADRLHPELQIELESLEAIQHVMSRDARPGTRPILREVATSDDLLADVGLDYDKGQAVLGMFESWIGEERFRKGVRAYLAAHAWSNASASDLWAALSAEAGADLASAMTSFIAQPGFPLISVERLDGGRIRLRQQRFLNIGSAAPPLVWKVPVLLRWSDGTSIHRERVLLAEPEATLTLGATPRWVLPDDAARGYYRWSVPDEMLGLLAADADLTPRERIAFVGNAASLLEAGRLSGGSFFDLLSPFASDPAPQVVSYVISQLYGIEEAFVTPDLEDEWASWLGRTFRPALDRIGFEPKAGEGEAVTLLRPHLVRLLGQSGRDEDVRRFAADQARRHMNGEHPSDPSLLEVLLELRAAGGDAAVFDAYRERFEKAATPADRDRFLRALGAFRQPAQRERALAYALAGPLRPTELMTIPRELRSTVAGEERAWTWTKANYGTIVERLPGEFRSFLPHMAAGCSNERLDDARRFFADGHGDDNSQRQLARVAEEVEDCVRLREREGAGVRVWLEAAALRPGSPRDDAPVAAPRR